MGGGGEFLDEESIEDHKPRSRDLIEGKFGMILSLAVVVGCAKMVRISGGMITTDYTRSQIFLALVAKWLRDIIQRFRSVPPSKWPFPFRFKTERMRLPQ